MKYSYKIVERSLLGDVLTPVSTYMRLRDLSSQSILMEGSDYHSGKNSRSFIALDPIATVSISHGMGRCEFPDGEVYEHEVNNEYKSDAIIREFMSRFEFVNGCDDVNLWGYTTFNAVRYFENIAVKDETQSKNDAPDMMYVLFRYWVEFDHFKNTMKVRGLAVDDDPDMLDKVVRALKCHLTDEAEFTAVGDFTSTLTDEEHKANIRRGIAHCKRGDVFQIVLSRRFIQRYEGDDFKLYRALRSINPSPYLFYMDMGGFRIFGSSPETHCRVEKSKVESKEERVESNVVSSESKVVYKAYIDPIAGTTKRTGDQVQDKKNAEYLRKDPKENAEHVMLVDLARNDLSRNCKDVKVDFYKELQYYSHVIHLVSRVSGTLFEGVDPVKAFIDTFPAGTLSGAPKVRAMQLISEYEPHNRGAYGGCVGSIGFNGELNQAITIRTFVSRNNELWFQAGGGIVAKSNEEYELQEVNNKLGALRRAILKAQEL